MFFTNDRAKACVSRECVLAAARILAIQAVVAPLDYAFWTYLVGMELWTVFLIVATLDVAPMLAQFSFVCYLFRRHLKESTPVVDGVRVEECCAEGSDGQEVQVAEGKALI